MLAAAHPLRRIAEFTTVSVLFGLVSAWIVWSIGHIPTDTGAHARFAQNVWQGTEDWPPNFLFYALLITIGEAINDTADLRISTAIVLGVAGAAKAYLTLWLLDSLTPRLPFRSLAIAAAVLLFSFSLPVALILGKSLHYFLGSVPPNVWHNATTMFLMPFAIAAFALQLQDFQERGDRRTAAIAILISLGVVAKPSYFLAYAPATALLALFVYRDMRARLTSMIPSLAGGILTIVLFIAIYYLQHGSHQDGASAITFAPMATWQTFVPASEIPLAIFGSFLVPIAYFAAGLRPDHALAMGYAGLQLAIALLIFVLAAETGPRATHGNLFWQTIVCSFLLHGVILADLLAKFQRGARQRSVFLCLGLFALMAISGVIYLFRLITAPDWFLPY